MTFFQNPGRLLWLILPSLLFLAVSQVLWINRVWKEQKNVLQQETNFIFQRTVMAMQDSLVRRSMTRNGIPMNEKIPLGGPIFDRPRWAGNAPPLATRTRIQFKKERGDTTECLPGEEPEQVQIFVTSTDSQPVALQRGLGRFFLNIQTEKKSNDPADIIFDIQSDTVSSQELNSSYALELENATLPTSFNLLVGKSPDAFSPSGTMMTEPALAGILRHHFYAAEFRDYNGYLMQKIVPYALFSLLLVCLTSLAFWLIFKSLKQQQKLAQQKNEFISNVTHELKTPLTTVGVALEALNDFEVMQNPEKTKEYLHISKLELERLNLLVDKVLRLSMFEQQALTLRPEILDLVSTTRQVIDAMTLQAKSTGASIHFESDTSSCLVSCDKLHLTGVVYNLLDNALKYRREPPEIVVSVETILRDGRTLAILKVRDNGIGIPPEYQRQIFEKFFRVPVGNTHNVKGHGLGLSYVAHVVREHGGSIRLESMAGQGSTFIVEIPVATPPPAV